MSRLPVAYSRSGHYGCVNLDSFSLSRGDLFHYFVKRLAVNYLDTLPAVSH